MADPTFPKDVNLDPARDSLTAASPIKDTGNSAEAGKRNPTALVREEASKLAGQASEKAKSFADTGKEKATGALDEFSTMMRDAATTVDEKLGEQYGKYARSAADQISGLAESLRGKQVDDLVEDARQFVKKSPAVAVGIAAGIGFIAARLVKSGIDATSDKSGLPKSDDKAARSDTSEPNN